MSTVYTIKNEDDDDQDEEMQDTHIYKSRPQLPKPGTFLRTLNYFMAGLNSESIDVNPEYQREVVWTPDRMSGLIDSLMENYYIPPVILNKKMVNTDEGPKQRFICVDGKQRLSSVKLFVQGKIPCKDYRGENWYFCHDPSVAKGPSKENIMDEAAQKEFLRKEFVSFEYADLSPEQEEDLFARVQMGIQLTSAEKLRASSGPWQELAKCYVDDFPIIYQLLKHVARAKDFQFTLACFSQILEVQHPSRKSNIPGLKTTPLSLTRLIDNTAAVSDASKSHLSRVWNTFQELIEMDPSTFNNADKHLVGVQTFAPVEMVAIVVLISLYSETRTKETLLKYINALRGLLREKFEDLKLNTPTWKFIWAWMDSLKDDQADQAIKHERINSSTSSTDEGISTSTTSPDGRLAKRPRVGSRPSSFNAVAQNPGTPRTSLAIRDTHTLSPAPAPNPGLPSARKSVQSSPQSTGTAHHNPPTTPSEARRNRISELNSYRAPTAPMGTVAPFASVGSPFSQAVPPPRSKSVLTGATAKSPSAKKKSEANLTQKKSPRNVKHYRSASRVLPQSDGAVDSADEEFNEQAAQDLLSSFQPRTEAARPPPPRVLNEVNDSEKQKDSNPPDPTPKDLAEEYPTFRRRRLIPQDHDLY